MSTALQITHVTWADWLIIALASGFAAAVFNQLVGGLISKLRQDREYRQQQALQDSEQRHGRAMQDAEQAFNARMQQDVRDDESLRLLIDAHFKQRDVLLESAIGANSWLRYELDTAYGPEHDYYRDRAPEPHLTNVTEVMAALEKISFSHPTRSARKLARELLDSVKFHYGEPDHVAGVLGGTPEFGELGSWLDKSEALIELMHTPPTMKEIRPGLPSTEGS